MKKTQLSQLLGLAVLGGLLSAHSVSADSTYTMQGMGGDLLSNAFITTGLGDLTEIDGAFSTVSSTSTAGIPDLFAIDLTAGTPFSATTVGTPGTVYDTQLFLFSATGYGIYYNDDDPIQVLAPGFQVGAGATLPSDYLPAGLYYLGISPEGAAPQSDGGNIFPNPLTDGVSLTGVYGPTGAGGAQPLSQWKISSDDVESGTYSIQLTGAGFAASPAVPEPSAFALIGLGLLPFVGLARRALTGRRRASERTLA